jgi:hypothetical protein
VGKVLALDIAQRAGSTALSLDEVKPTDVYLPLHISEFCTRGGRSWPNSAPKHMILSHAFFGCDRKMDLVHKFGYTM